MNNLQPFEKHLADQLQQVPTPNREEGWIEMRKLLDRELPEGGSAWSGNRKWWWMGITVAIIIAGLWMSEEFRRNETNSAQNVSARNNNASEKNDLSSKQVNEKTNSNNSTTSTQTTAQRSIAGDTDDKKEQTSKRSTQDVIAEKNTTNTGNSIAIKDNNTAHYTDQNLTLTSPTTNSRNKRGHPGVVVVGASTGVIVAGTSKGNTRGKSQKEITDAINNSTSSSADRVENNNNGEDEVLPAMASVESISGSQQFFVDPEDDLLSVPSYSQPLKIEQGKIDKSFAKQLRKQSIKDDNRKISARSMRGDMKEKDKELTFAAGLSLPQSFAIAGQQAPAYGVNASASRISDYLPVPFFQYHMNSKVFLQTELQFQTPQYTNKLLVYQDQQYITPSNMLEKNVYVEKLYYFHIPFNIYFSPARNFYIGSGLQFSSLLSGVATYQNNRYSGSTLANSSSKTEGFKDDSIASKLSSSEWRYQFDANYYLKRFTFGARYNQALSQFINLQPSPALPFTIGRNQSFFIYLRYNIWEERKKGSFYSE